jgi:hypothetical protein
MVVGGGDLERKVDELKSRERLYVDEIGMLHKQLELQGSRVSMDLYKMALDEAGECEARARERGRELDAARERVRSLERQLKRVSLDAAVEAKPPPPPPEQAEQTPQRPAARALHTYADKENTPLPAPAATPKALLGGGQGRHGEQAEGDPRGEAEPAPGRGREEGGGGRAGPGRPAWASSRPSRPCSSRPSSPPSSVSCSGRRRAAASARTWPQSERGWVLYTY